MINLKNWDIKTTLWSLALAAIAFVLFFSTPCRSDLRMVPDRGEMPDRFPTSWGLDS